MELMFMNFKKMIIGEKLKLLNYINSNFLEVELYINSSMTIDFTCFGLDSNKKLSDDKYMIFYNQVKSPENSIELYSQNKYSNKFKIDLNRIPSNIKNLVFTSTIDGNGTMSNISIGYMSIFSNGKEIIRFEFKGNDFKNEKAILIGEIYFKDTWRLGSIGKGFNGGLSALLKHFGGEEKNSTTSSSIKTSTINTPATNDSEYYYTILNTTEKKIYDLIKHGLKNFETKINLYFGQKIDKNKVTDIAHYVQLDNPQLFYVQSHFNIIWGSKEFWYQPSYNYSANSLSNYKRIFDNKVNEILRKTINPSMNDYEKELAVHNYLVLNVSYDYKSLSSKNPPQDIYSAYGAIINNKAVCSGYASATKLLLNKCNIDSIIVTGTSMMPENNSYISHAWNIVKINNKFYQLDVTWDSPINKKPGELRFDYFNITDSEISIDHKWDKNMFPRCTNAKENYFVKQGLIFNNLTNLKNQIIQLISNKKRQLLFKFYSQNEKLTTQLLNDMISNIWTNPSLSFSGSLNWSISYNDKLSVFKIEFNY